MLSPPYSPHTPNASDEPVPPSHRHRRLSKLPAELASNVVELRSQSSPSASRPNSASSSAVSSTYDSDSEHDSEHSLEHSLEHNLEHNLEPSSEHDTDSDTSLHEKLRSSYRRSVPNLHKLKRSAYTALDLPKISSAPAGTTLTSYDASSLSESDISPVLPGRERRMTTCWDALKQNPQKYLRLERNLLDLYPLRRHSWAGPGIASFSQEELSELSTNALRSPPTSASSSTGVTGRGRGRKPGRQPGSGRGRRRASVTSSDLAARSHPSPQNLNSEVFTDNHWRNHNESGQFCTTKPSVAPSSSGSALRVHDLSYNQLKDYSPCISLLPPGKSLRAEWKGAPMDLSADPDLGLLHPAEAHLASVLRLPCDVYLDSKRRLFAEKVHRLKQGLPFRRTDSQKACRIDVNKASRLFGAFEKIGWLEDNLFMKYLDDK